MHHHVIVVFILETGAHTQRLMSSVYEASVMRPKCNVPRVAESVKGGLCV